MKKLIILPILLSIVILQGQEAINLGTPIITANVTQYVPASLKIQLVPQAAIEIVIVSSTGRAEVFNYPCPVIVPVGPCTTDTIAEVESLITTLNTANLSTRSLWRRVFDRLVLDFPSRFPGGGTVQ